MADTVVPNEAFQTEDVTIHSALRQIFITCKNHNKLALGATEVVKSLMRATSAEDLECLRLVVVAKDLLQEFQDIIVERCRALNVSILYVDDRKQLAEISPLKRVKNIGVIGIKDFVYESREKAFIVNAYKN